MSYSKKLAHVEERVKALKARILTTDPQDGEERVKRLNSLNALLSSSSDLPIGGFLRRLGLFEKKEKVEKGFTRGVVSAFGTAITNPFNLRRVYRNRSEMLKDPVNVELILLRSDLIEQNIETNINDLLKLIEQKIGISKDVVKGSLKPLAIGIIEVMSANAEEFSLKMQPLTELLIPWGNVDTRTLVTKVFDLIDNKSLKDFLTKDDSIDKLMNTLIEISSFEAKEKKLAADLLNLDDQEIKNFKPVVKNLLEVALCNPKGREIFLDAIDMFATQTGQEQPLKPLFGLISSVAKSLQETEVQNHISEILQEFFAQKEDEASTVDINKILYNVISLLSKPDIGKAINSDANEIMNFVFENVPALQNADISADLKRDVFAELLKVISDESGDDLKKIAQSINKLSEDYEVNAIFDVINAVIYFAEKDPQNKVLKNVLSNIQKHKEELSKLIDKQVAGNPFLQQLEIKGEKIIAAANETTIKNLVNCYKAYSGQSKKDLIVSGIKLLVNDKNVRDLALKAAFSLLGMKIKEKLIPNWMRRYHIGEDVRKQIDKFNVCGKAIDTMSTELKSKGEDSKHRIDLGKHFEFASKSKNVERTIILKHALQHRFCKGLDLSSNSFHDMHIEGFNFTDVTFSGSAFKGAYIKETNFSNLKGKVNFEGAILDEVSYNSVLEAAKKNRNIFLEGIILVDEVSPKLKKKSKGVLAKKRQGLIFNKRRKKEQGPHNKHSQRNDLSK